MKYKLIKYFLLCGLGIAMTKQTQASSFYGVICNDTIWSDTVNVTGDIFVDSGATLIILPGTMVLFADTADWDTACGIDKKCDLIVRGKLKAKGTEADSIKLTSLGRWGMVGFQYSFKDTLLYTYLSKLCLGIYCDYSEIFMGNSCIDDVYYSDTLDNHLGAGVYAFKSRISLNGNMITNCQRKNAKTLSNVAAVYAETSYCVIKKNYINSIKGVDDYSSEWYLPPYPFAYGLFVVGGDTLVCDSNTINNISGGGGYYLMGTMGRSGGSGMGIKISNTSYAWLTHNKISNCSGGLGEDLEIGYSGVSAGAGGDGVVIQTFGDVRLMAFNNNLIDSCSGGKGGYNLNYSSWSGKGGNGICFDIDLIGLDKCNNCRFAFAKGGIGWPNGYGIGVKINDFLDPIIIGGISGEQNTIMNNVDYNIWNQSINNVNATYNYWGTNDTTLIRAKIYDHFVNAALGYVLIDPLVVSVEGEPGVAHIFNFELQQNTPNPFRIKTSIKYQLKKEGLVSLKIFNLEGQLVKTLVSEVQPAGTHQINWDAKAAKVADGIYFYCLEFEGRKSVKRMTLIK
jgi:hypothetical protein